MTRWLFDVLGSVGEQIARSGHLILYLDYDGTLATIVDEPDQAFLSPPVQRLLLSLATHEKVSIAVISGRDRADLQAHVGIPELIYVGNHGLEISGPGYLFIEPTAAAHSGALHELAADLTRKLQPMAGVVVEDKGLTLSVHFRRAAAEDVEAIRGIVHTTLASADYPFVLNMGHKVFEIRPRVHWNKGTAVGWIKDKLSRPDTLAIYAGDDVTDEDAFGALPDGITIKVGEMKVGEAVETAARYHVEDPGEVHRFLEWLDGVLRQRERDEGRRTRDEG